LNSRETDPSVFLQKNDTTSLIELATSKKSRDQQREEFQELNKNIAQLRFSGGVLE